MCLQDLLVDQNQYERGICMSLLDAEQKYRRLLILKRKCVSCNDKRKRTKITDKAKIPHKLYVGSKSYRLSSVIIHSGESPDSGHFYCVCHGGGSFPEYTWYRFDDESTTSGKAADLNEYLAELPNDTPYVCIYEQSLMI